MTNQNMQSLLLGKIAAYTEILVKDPSSTIFVSLAETYRKMGLFEDARQILVKGMELHSDFPPAYIVMGRVLCQLDDFDGSVAAFERALELDPESLAALVGYARVQILLGNEAAARALLLSARKLSPADPVINKLLLSLPDEVSDENVAEAPPDQQEAETAPLISSTLADLYLDQGLPEKALDIYQQLSRQNPDDLNLRRRVREVESLVTADSAATPLEPESAAEFPAEKTTQVESQEAHVTADPVLETLNQWLVNIQLRRENV